MQDMARTHASYCCFGYPYRKNTLIFSNIPALKLKTCCPQDCFWKMKGHPMNLQNSPPEMRAKIPKDLCLEILFSVCNAMDAPLRARILLKRRARRHRIAAELQPYEKRTNTKRGRPKHTTEGLSCAVCSTEEAKFYYANTQNPLCNRCYRQRRRDQSCLPQANIHDNGRVCYNTDSLGNG